MEYWKNSNNSLHSDYLTALPGNQRRKEVGTWGYRRYGLVLMMVISFTVLGATFGAATEGAGSVYPLGVETVLPGMTPGSGQTIFQEFNMTFHANEALDGQGHSAAPGFKLSVWAFAPKVVHNWGVHVLGGEWVSWVATPVANIWLQSPAGRYSTTGFSNPVIANDIAYNRGNWHWWYGLDVETPAPVYHKDSALNVGQHNFATTPSGAFTYLPNHGRTEISSRLQYIVNYTNPADHYHSGNEFLWEYVATQNLTKKLAVGVNGYFYQQTTADRLLGAAYASGYQGRDLAVGPEVRYELGHMLLIAKYSKDTLVRNRACGNAVWIEFGLPLSHPHQRQQAS